MVKDNINQNNAKNDCDNNLAITLKIKMKTLKQIIK